MNVNEENRFPASAANSTREPTPPPVDPADRPTIEPTDALPTEKQDEPGLLDKAKSLFSDEATGDAPAPAPVTASRVEPTPPPVNPADRPTIEPTDALPTEE
jgi:hypothetical protein